jgi:large repetitive protein
VRVRNGGEETASGGTGVSSATRFCGLLLLLLLTVAWTATAQTVVQNSASVQPPAGQTDLNPGDNVASVAVQVYAVTVAKTGSPAEGVPVAPGDTLGFTLTVTVTGTDTAEPTVFTDTLSAGLTLVPGSLPAGCTGSGQSAICTLPAGSAPATYSWSYQATVNADATGTVSNAVTGGQGCTAGGSCTVTHPVYFGLTLDKTWVNGQTGNAVDLDISGAGNEVIPLQAGSSTAGGPTTPARAAVAPGAGVTVSESFTSGDAANYTAALACTRTDNGAAVPSGGGTLTMPTDTGVACTFTNIRQSATLQLVKTWVNARVGETATVSSAGFTNDATTGESVSTGNNTTTGTAVTVYAGDVGNLGEGLSNGANYDAVLSCTGNSAPLAGVTLTVSAGDTAIVCGYTNTRRQATLSLAKTWVNGLPGDTAEVTSTGFENAASSGVSTSTGSNTTTGASVVVYAGEAGTIAETLSNAANYDATLACTGSTQALAGTQLTIDPADTAITCTQTNSRHQVNLTLRKSWVDAAVGETVEVSATGSTSSPITLTSVADTPTGIDTGTPVQVYAGESITLEETFAVPGNAANYTPDLTCTGSSGLSGNTLLVGQGDSNIICTFTNTRPQTTLQLVKTWAADSRNGDVAQLGSTTGLQNNTSAFTSTASIGANSSTVTVYIGEQATLPAETMSGAALGNYTVALSCTGGALAGTDGKAANTLDITPADAGTPIVCTYTNTRTATTLTLQKTWLNGFLNDSVTVGATGLTPLQSVSTGAATQTDTGPAQTIHAGDVLNLTESFASVTSNLYASTLSCTNTSGLVVNTPTTGTLTVGPADGPITCTYVNDRRSAELIVRKVWSGGGPASTVSIPPSSGFINNTPGFTSTSPTPNQVGPVTVYAFENGALGPESFTGGSAADYSSTLTCDGTDTNPADGLNIAVADADTTITCTYSNTFVPRSDISVQKTTPVTSVSGPGEVIPYTITVTNTGNVPLSNVTVVDPLIAGNLVCSPATPVASLDAGATISCTGSYTVTQADIDRIGSGDGINDDLVTNSVTAGGTDPDGNTVSDDDTTNTTLPQRNYVAEFDKNGSLADANGNGTASVGEVITYNFTVNNAGNATIQSVTIADPRLPGLSCAPAGPLAPGDSLTFGVSPPADIACTGNTYTITQADVDSRGDGDGDLDNTATGTATAPGGGSVSGDATASVPLDPPAPQLDLEKSASPTQVAGADEVITYTFVVSNPGNVTVDNITVTDPKPGLSAITCTPAAPFSLAPGASATCSATYTVTQADVDSLNAITNTATATGDYDGTPVDDSDDATVIINHGTVQPEFFKIADRTSVSAVGDVITYTFRVNNPSTVTLTNMQIVDDTLLDGVACNTIASLAPGDSVDFTCTGNTYATQQSDIDNQGNPVFDSRVIRNEVTGQAQYQIGSNPVVTVTAVAAANVNLPLRAPGIFLTKNSDVASVTGPNQPITYSFVVQNTGNVTLTNVVISDPFLPGLSCPPIASLTPGPSVSVTGCTGNVYTVTQADIDSGSTDRLPGNGQIDNLATVVGDTPVAGVTVSDNGLNQVNLPVRGPQMTLVKSADVTSISAPGTINYRFTVTNSGNVTLEDVTVSDADIGLVCPSLDIAPGQSVVFGGSGADVVCTGTTRTVTQADIDAGTAFVNVATANGTSQAAGAISRTSSLSIPVARSPALGLTKVADVASVARPGDPVTYTLTATNNGNTTLTNVTLSDPMLPSLTCTPTIPVAALAPAAAISCQGTYLATQADFDTNGGGDQNIDNTATATADGLSTTASARVALPLPVQSLSIDKTAGTPSVDQGRDPAVTDAGDTIPYTFVVTNTGNQSLSTLAVIDSNIDAAATCDRTVLTASGPDSTATCTGVHTITQADMDNGTVSNTATAEGTPPNSSRVSSSPDSAVVTLAAAPVLVLDKTANDPTVSGGALPAVTDAGDTISYSFVVTNNGNVTLNNITVGDPLPGIGPILCPPGQLAPGASTTCSTVVYTITQADMDAGAVTNIATGQGTPPTGPNATGSDSTTTPLTAGPALTLVKTANPTTYATVGQTISYSYLATNTGNVTLNTLAITDDRIASVSCPVTTLAPAASTTCTGSYAITQADLDAGSVTNTATATATPAQGSLPAVTAQATITAVQNRSLGLVKSSTASSYAAVGDVLPYSYVVTNTGNITLTDPVTVGDDRIAAVSCPALPAGGFAPGTSLTCTGSYTVTQADLDAGSITNVATAQSGSVVSGTSTVTINANQQPALGLDKTTTSTTFDSVGDTLAYSYRVTNTGNVTLTTAITVSDDRILTPNSVSCPPLPGGGLAPGAEITCTATYTITQADLDAGSVTNTATAQSGATTSAPDSVTVTGVQTPALTMDKIVSNAPDPVVLGSVLEYTVTGTNSGNTTLTNVVISDAKITPASTTCASVAPGGSCVLVGTYTVTQADVDAGQVLNIGSGISDTTPQQPSPPTITPVQQLRGLRLDKSSPTATYQAVGDVLSYSYLVTNTGTVTVTSPITVSDDRIVAPATVNCPALPAGGLAPAASITCTASYSVTQADLNLGSVTNTATASDGTSTSPPDSVTINATQLPAITLDKTASVADSNSDGITGDAGDVITYAFSVTNTGNVLLAPVNVADPLLPGLVCLVPTLAPGASASCTATGNQYTITFADEAATAVVNTATATGNAPGSAPDATATDTVTTPTALTPAAITVNKVADPASGQQVAPDDVVLFTVTVTVANNELHEPVTLTDTLDPGLTLVAVNNAGAFTCTTGNPLVCTLPAGTATGSYPLVYSARVDTDATGTLRNTVVPSKPAGVDPAPTCQSCSTEHPVVPSTATVSKAADPVSGSFVQRGQGITYTVTAVIAGSVTTQPLLLNDTLDAGLGQATVTSAGAYSCTGNLACVLPAGTLPGTYPLVYTVTVAADASGTLRNAVTAGNLPGGDPDPVCVSCSTEHIVEQPALDTLKRLGGNSNASGEVTTGDTLTYVVSATNTGNTVLSNVTIEDALITPSQAVCASVAPGASCELTGTYVVTQADTDAGTVDNTARITAEPGPGGAPLPPPVCPAGSADARCTPVLNLPIARRPALATTKSAVLSVDRGTPGKGNADDVITYTVAASNTGNVTLDQLVIQDTLQGGTPTTLSCAPTTLVPGQSASCTPYDHTITEADAGVDGGTLTNTVLATAQPTGAGLASATATAAAVVEVENAPADIRLTKVAGVREVKRGDLVRYTLIAQNVGDIDLVDGYLIDTPPPGFTYVEGSLQGDDDDHHVTASGSYPLRINDLDIAAGNSATLSYLMRVGAGVRPGTQVNHAQVFAPTDKAASNVATAEVVTGSDPLLDDSLIMGSVFDDRDGDGWQDSAELTGLKAQGGFAADVYLPGSTTLDRGGGPQPVADASAPLLHGLALGSVSGRLSEADPASQHTLVVRQRLREPRFTDDFVLTSRQGITVRMDAEGRTTTERSGDAAKGLTAAAPSVQRRVMPGEGGVVVDYVIANEGIDESGIPGVRIGSVEGLLMETDQFGRYHVVGIEGGGLARGRNFILKVDAATLPEGSRFITRNPQLRRITPGVPARFDFAVQLPVKVLEQQVPVELVLGTVFFAADSAEVAPRFQPVIDTMAARIREQGKGEVVIAGSAGSEALALARAQAVRQALLTALGGRTQDVAVLVRADVDDPASLLVGVDQGGSRIGTVLFDTDRAGIRADMQPLLRQLAADLEQRGGGRVVIVGHADVRGAPDYNVQLGLRRAQAVYAALRDHLSPAVRERVQVDVDPDPAAPLDARDARGEGR